MQLGGLFVGFPDDNPGSEYRPVVTEQLEAGDGGIDDNPVSRHLTRQPAQPFEVDHQLPQPRFGCGRPFRRCAHGFVPYPLSAEHDRPVFGVGAAHNLVFGGGGGQGFDHPCRIGSGNRGIDHLDDVDRFGCQILVVLPLLDRHRPPRQRIGIGKKCVGEQQIPFHWRQVRAALAERVAVVQYRLETMVSGAQHCLLQQAAGFRGVPVPHGLKSVRIIEAAQQPGMEPLPGDCRLARRVEPRLDLGIAGEGGRIRGRGIEPGRIGACRRVSLCGDGRP